MYTNAMQNLQNLCEVDYNPLRNNRIGVKKDYFRVYQFKFYLFVIYIKRNWYQEIVGRYIVNINQKEFQQIRNYIRLYNF